MICLLRNKKPFYYALYEGKEEIIDENGDYTGEYETKYSEPILFKANISASVGSTDDRQFGESIHYDRTIITDDMSIPINEYSRLWVDELDINKPHDYQVTKVARSLNNVIIAISKVDVSD